MNVKKCIVAIATSVVTFASLGSVAASAITQVYTNQLIATVNLSTYSAYYVGNCATHYANITNTANVATNPDYYDAYKYVKYVQYGTSNGSQYYIGYRENDGTGTAISTTSMSIGSNVTDKSHVSRIYYSDSQSSGIMEKFTAYLSKA